MPLVVLPASGMCSRIVFSSSAMLKTAESCPPALGSSRLAHPCALQDDNRAPAGALKRH